MTRHLEEISEEASRALGEVREISYDLRPYQLDRLGLTKAVEEIVRHASTASQTVFTFDIDNIDNMFPEASRINFYRIVQESVNNIIKHAEATRASITVHCTPGSLRLEIRDNGKGFLLDAVNAPPRQGGWGLTGITERVRWRGGYLPN